jgi:hypothetical protein
MKKAIVVATGLVLFFAMACKKKSGSDNGNTTAAQAISNTWLYDTAAFDTDKNGVADQPLGTLEQACDLDNSFTFKSDGSGIFDEGAVKCDDADPQTASFGWALKNGDSTITFSGDIMDELKGDAQILQLSSTTLQLSKAINLTSPVQFSANLIITLKR